MILTVAKSFKFEASHVLPRHPGKCSRLHGHSWELTVSITNHINPETGFVKDFAEISAFMKPIIDQLDHYHLGAFIGNASGIAYSPLTPYDFYPSSENLLVLLAEKLRGLDWSTIKLSETCTSSAYLTRADFEEAQSCR